MRRERDSPRGLPDPAICSDDRGWSPMTIPNASGAQRSPAVRREGLAGRGWVAAYAPVGHVTVWLIARRSAWRDVQVPSRAMTPTCSPPSRCSQRLCRMAGWSTLVIARYEDSRCTSGDAWPGGPQRDTGSEETSAGGACLELAAVRPRQGLVRSPPPLQPHASHSSTRRGVPATSSRSPRPQPSSC